MKQFFEQYGGVALGILALLVLIAMITPVGNIIKTSLQGTVQTFSTKIDGQTDTMTEQMNKAFENAVTYKGTMGDLLTDAQYNYLKDHFDDWHNDETFVFYGLRNEYVDEDDKLSIYKPTECILSTENNSTIYRCNNTMIGKDGTIDNPNRKHILLFTAYYPSKVLYNSGVTEAYIKATSGPIDVATADSCETLNLGCEVS